MTHDLNHLIASLAEDVKPARPQATPVKLLLRWLALSLAYVLVVLAFGGLRQDIAIVWASVEFTGEVMLLAAMVLASGYTAVLLSYPDQLQRKGVLYVPVLLFAAFVLWVGAALLNEPANTPLPPHGIECLLCICMYSLVPVVVMVLLLRKQATTHPVLTGAISFLTAFSLGCLALRLSEDTNSIHHLITWHYAPMAGAALIGMLLGRRLLRW